MDKAVYLEELRAKMAKALSELSEKQRHVVIMRYFQNREYAEIADALNISQGNARVILSRALDQLEQNFKNTESDWSVS